MTATATTPPGRAGSPAAARRTTCRLALTTLLLIVAVACAEPAPDTADDASPEPPVETATPEPDTTEPAAPAESADVPAELDFVLPALDGGEVDGAALAGRDVILWFWTPW